MLVDDPSRRRQCRRRPQVSQRPAHPLLSHITSDSSSGGWCLEPRPAANSFIEETAAEQQLTPKPTSAGNSSSCHQPLHLISSADALIISSTPTTTSPTSTTLNGRLSCPPTRPPSQQRRQRLSKFIRSMTGQQHLAYKLLFILHLIIAFSSFSSSSHSAVQVGKQFTNKYLTYSSHNYD